jgi:hypothetical protein
MNTPDVVSNPAYVFITGLQVSRAAPRARKGNPLLPQFNKL